MIAGNGPLFRVALSGWPVAKKNRRRIVGGKSLPSRAWEVWRGECLPEVIEAWMEQRVRPGALQVPPKPLSQPVVVRARFWLDDFSRRRDGDNSITSILDLLVDAGVLLDDCVEIVRGVQWDAKLLQDHPDRMKAEFVEVAIYGT